MKDLLQMNLFHLAVVAALIAVAAAVNVGWIKKFGAYDYARKHVLAYTLFILPLVCAFYLYIVYLSGQDNSVEKLTDTFADLILNVVSNYVILAAFGLTYFIEKRIRNNNEDKEKLTTDYKSLLDTYKKETNFVSAGDTRYPVVSLGKGDICVYQKEGGIDVSAVEILDKKTEYVLPRLIENNFSSIMKAHDTSVIYNNLNIRATGLELKDNCLKISTERTYYYYSMVTNRAIDYEWAEDGVTVRSIYEPGPMFRPLDQACLSNHLGFNGFVATKDGYVVFVKRSKDLSIAKRTYGDSIGASLKTAYALEDDGGFTAKKLVEAILTEIKHELKIDMDRIMNIHIIGAYRDGLEGGKPQLCFCAETDLEAKEMDKEFIKETKAKLVKDIKKKKKLKDSRERRRLKAEKKVLEDGEKLVWINKALLPRLQFNIDEVRLNGPVQDQNSGFFEIKNTRNILTGQEKTKTKLLKKQYLPMVPSASASLVMFKDHLGGLNEAGGESGERTGQPESEAGR